MSFTVSIRETEKFGEKLRNGEEVTFPEECTPNSEIIYEILMYANRIMPAFDLVTDEERRLIADVVAYVMRPDLLKQSRIGLGPSPINRVMSEYTNPVPLYNDPAELNLEWDIPKDNEYFSRGSEYFRCFTCVMAWIPGMYDKLDPVSRSLAPAFKMADLCSFLIDPNELEDYHYTYEEIAQFNKTLEKEMDEV